MKVSLSENIIFSLERTKKNFWNYYFSIKHISFYLVYWFQLVLNFLLNSSYCFFLIDRGLILDFFQTFFT